MAVQFVPQELVDGGKKTDVGLATKQPPAAESLLTRAARAMARSARGISRCMGVVRTIACLAHRDEIEDAHIAAAPQHRILG